MKKTDLVLVGAGISGLSSALELLKVFSVTVVDRLPVCGGINAGYENHTIKLLERSCRKSGVRLLLGTTALRWSTEKGLLTVGPGGIVWLPGKHLIYAGGIRPSILSEMGIQGDRVSGIFPGMVGYHLLETGVRLGNCVVLIGGGTWAMKIGELIKRQGGKVKLLPVDEIDSRPDFADEWWPGWVPTSIHGKGRVSEVWLKRKEIHDRILCDAVVLAAKMRPIRNVEGAIFEESSKQVTFIQLVGASTTLDERAAYAKQCAEIVLSNLN